MSYDAATHAFVLVESAPNGAEKVVELFTADSSKAAQAYAAQLNKPYLDKHLQRFRVAGRYVVLELFHDDRPEYADVAYYTGL